MPETVGFAYLDIVPTMRNAQATIGKELGPTLATAGREAGVVAGREVASGMQRGAAESSKKVGSGLFANIEKGAAVSGTATGRRFGMALHESLGTYVKQIGAMAVGFFAFEKVKETVADVFHEGEQAQKTLAVLEAHIQSTGGVAGITAAHIEELAASQSKLVGIDKDTIEQGASLELTFSNIRNEAGKGNDVFDRTLSITEDLAATYGLKLPNAMRLAGRAVNDPVHGLTMLTRYGIQFTDQQKAQIATLEASGKSLEAQKLVLDQLGKRFGGAAHAADTPMQQLRTNVTDLEQELGLKLIPVVNTGAEDILKLGHAVDTVPAPVMHMTEAFVAFYAAQKIGLISSVATGIEKTGAVLDTLRFRAALAADVYRKTRAGEVVMTDGLVTGFIPAAGRSRAAMAGVEAGATGMGRSMSVLKGAFVFTAAVEGVNLLDDALDNLFHKRLDGSDLDRSLQALQGGRVEGTIAQAFGHDLKDLPYQVDEANSAIQRFASKIPLLGSVLVNNPFNASKGNYKDAVSNFQQIDDALAGLVEGGNAREASSVFNKLAIAAQAGGKSTGDLTKLLPQYELALDNAKGATEGTTGATQTDTAALKRHAAALQAQEKALHASRQAARETGHSFMDLSKDADDSKVSLDQWLGEMRKQAHALTDFADNAEKAGRRGLREGLIKYLETLGPTGALRMQQLADATKSQLARANRSWSDWVRAVNHGTTVMSGVPPIHVQVDDSQALSAIARVKAELSSVKPVYRTEYYVTQVNAANKRHKATGGLLVGPGTETSDSIPVMGSNGEYMVRAAAVRKYGVGFFDAANAMRLAGGGSVGKQPHGLTLGELRGIQRQFSYGQDPTGKDVRDAFHAFEHAIRQAGGHVTEAFARLEKQTIAQAKAYQLTETEIGKYRTQLHDLRQQRSEQAQSVSGMFVSSLFGEQTQPNLPAGIAWLSAANRAAYEKANGGGGSGGLFATLTSDIANARQFTALEKRLRRRGLHGQALADAEREGGLSGLEQLNALPDSDLARFERLFNLRAHVAGEAGQVSGNQLVGVKIDRTNHHLQQLEQRAQRQEKALHEIQKEIRDSSDRTGQSLARALVGVLVKARHKTKHGG